MPPVCGAFATRVGRKVKKAHVKKELYASEPARLLNKKRSASEFARLDPFTRGMIWGMHLAKVPREENLQHVFKKDGSRPKIRAIDYFIAHKVAQPAWKGEDTVAGGRPSALTNKEKSVLLKLVFKMRGRAVVTAPWCRRQLQFLRKVSLRCVQRALNDAGLAWLGRRTKSWINPIHKAARLLYCDWI